MSDCFCLISCRNENPREESNDFARGAAAEEQPEENKGNEETKGEEGKSLAALAPPQPAAVALSCLLRTAHVSVMERARYPDRLCVAGERERN